MSEKQAMHATAIVILVSIASVVLCGPNLFSHAMIVIGSIALLFQSAIQDRNKN